MKPIFKKVRGHFEKKSQVAPNALIYQETLSDAAVRLILALNALPDSWTIIQSDIQNRLCWNRKKMQKVIRECVESGYMKVYQNRQKKGLFSQNSFEFDTVPSFLNSEENDHSEKCPHNDCEPRDVLRRAVEPRTVNGSLLVSFVESNSIKEQTNKVESVESVEEKPVLFVCSHSDEIKIRERVKPYLLSESCIRAILTLSFEQIDQALIAYDQYAAKNTPDNPIGCIRQAIMAAWKPNVTTQDKEKNAKKEHTKKIELCELNRTHALSLYMKYKSSFNDRFKFDITDHCIYLKHGNRTCACGYIESDFKEILKAYIDNNNK